MKFAFGLVVLGLVLMVSSNGSAQKEAAPAPVVPIPWLWDYLSSHSCQRIRSWGLCKWTSYFWLCRKTCWWSPCWKGTEKKEGGGCKTNDQAPGSPEEAGGKKPEPLLAKNRALAIRRNGFNLQEVDEANFNHMSENRAAYWWPNYLSW